MQKSQQFAVIGAAVIGVAVLFMVRLYLDQQRQMIADEERTKVKEFKEQLQLNQANQVSVLVAKKDILVGEAIKDDSLEPAIIPASGIQPNAATYTDRVLGLIAVAPIAKGEQILTNKLSTRREASEGSLAMATPAGKRAITIPVDNISSLAGMIKPGDYVDIIVMVPLPAQNAEGKITAQPAAMPVFQNVLILAIGREIGLSIKSAGDSRYKKEEPAQAAAQAESPLLTLALTPAEISLMSFIQEQGKVRLVLRSPADSQLVSPQPANWDAILRSLMPLAPPGGEDLSVAAGKPGRGEAPPVDTVPPVKTVEIYRGIQKEVVNLSNK